MGATIAGWFTNKIVQLAAGVLAIVGVVLIPVTMYQAAEIYGFLWMDGLKQQRDDAFKVRDAAVTNYDTCKTNRQGLQIAANHQNVAIIEQAELSAAAIGEANRAAAAANAKWQALQSRWTAFVAHKPAGATACERAQDTDAHFLEAIQ